MDPTGQRVSRRWPLVACVVVAVLIVAGAFALRARRDHHAGPAPIRQWVAVLDEGNNARDLYSHAQTVGEVAGVYVFVDRWACYSGFPPGTPKGEGEWFLGVAATDRSIVDDIVARLGRAPLAEAQVEQSCAPPADTAPDGAQT